MVLDTGCADRDSSSSAPEHRSEGAASDAHRRSIRCPPRTRDRRSPADLRKNPGGGNACRSDHLRGSAFQPQCQSSQPNALLMQPIAGFIGELVAPGYSSGRCCCHRGALTGRPSALCPVSEADLAGGVTERAPRARLGFERFAPGRVTRCRSAALEAVACSSRAILDMARSSERASGSPGRPTPQRPRMAQVRTSRRNDASSGIEASRELHLGAGHRCLKRG
jgi:hypothetical protein